MSPTERAGSGPGGGTAGPFSPAEAAAPQEAAASYEHARDELASVVATLETGGLTLDESITLWERGEHLARECTRFLDGARQRVETALARASQSSGADGSQPE